MDAQGSPEALFVAPTTKHGIGPPPGEETLEMFETKKPEIRLSFQEQKFDGIVAESTSESAHSILASNGYPRASRGWTTGYRYSAILRLSYAAEYAYTDTLPTILFHSGSETYPIRSQICQLVSANHLVPLRLLYAANYADTDTQFSASSSHTWTTPACPSPCRSRSSTTAECTYKSIQSVSPTLRLFIIAESYFLEEIFFRSCVTLFSSKSVQEYYRGEAKSRKTSGLLRNPAFELASFFRDTDIPLPYTTEWP